MQVVRMENKDGTKRNALLVPKNEWERLNKILTKNDDDRAAVEKAKRVRAERSALSKAMAETWGSSMLLNKRKIANENKMRLLAENEARRQKKDEEIRLEHMERDNAIVEKSRAINWSNKDSIKTVTRAVRKTEMLGERAMQVEFNEAEKARMLEEQRLLKLEQNADAERYTRERCEQKLKRAREKEALTAVFLKELKKREELRRDEELRLKKEGELELQRITREIEEEKEKEKTRIRVTKENIWKNVNENREIVMKNNEQRELDEQRENTAVAVMNETKKKIAKLKRLKEIELLEQKQKRAQTLAEKRAQKENLLEKPSDQVARAVDEKEKQYEKERLREEESKKARKRDFEEYKRAEDEHRRKEEERLALSHQWELNRRLLETQRLRDLDKSRRQESINERKLFREQLDAKCESNRKARMAEKQADLDYYESLIEQWRQEDEKFVTYTNGLMDKYKKTGTSVVPLREAIKMFTAA